MDAVAPCIVLSRPIIDHDLIGGTDRLSALFSVSRLPLHANLSAARLIDLQLSIDL
jgi:hypothetical protein